MRLSHHGLGFSQYITTLSIIGNNVLSPHFYRAMSLLVSFIPIRGKKKKPHKYQPLIHFLPLGTY